ncbi:hypothetical protein [Pleomorphomonas diazotrophica]|uniref:hypothetical protein n=1 Tax=Pleomorphomonas diazotrophica TaxID=1166257 RepID=UPI0011808F3F|nr:hypothetical protein [Pleomorphomonas diazotrophica]
MAAVVSSTDEAAVVLSVEDAVDDASEESGGGGVVIEPSLSPVCSWSDRRADCRPPSSAEKALFDETVPVVAPPSWLLEGDDGAKDAVADVALLLEDPKSAARLLALPVKAERDDICCLREIPSAALDVRLSGTRR